MIKIIIFISIFSSCGIVDSLDGHIDNINNCCSALTKDRIVSCLADHLENGECQAMTCHPPTNNITVCIKFDGNISVFNE